ncbi:MAG: hypothetical protein ACRCR9_04880 [Chitinophagaceae bacterium]
MLMSISVFSQFRITTSNPNIDYAYKMPYEAMDETNNYVLARNEKLVNHLNDIQRTIIFCRPIQGKELEYNKFVEAVSQDINNIIDFIYNNPYAYTGAKKSINKFSNAIVSCLNNTFKSIFPEEDRSRILKSLY